VKTVYFSLGSNLGDRKVNLRRALKLMSPEVKIEARSPVYDTDPLYFTDQPRFYNVVVCGKTSLTPTQLLAHTQGIEAQMGRTGATHNRPRVVDIDILTYGKEVISTDDLTLPHPRITERAFVLVPLRDIAPGFTHPVSGATVENMLARIPDWQEQVKRTNVRV